MKNAHAASGPVQPVKVRVRRWGGELAVLVPRPVAEDEGLAEGDIVAVTLRKER